MILLATDLDRTLLPNGPQSDDNSLSKLFSALKEIPNRLVYVTGRNLALVHDAQKKFDIPTPDYLIAEVGTSMFYKEAENLVPEQSWIAHLRSHEQNWDSNRIINVIGTQHSITLQENWKQNQFKISYYLFDTVQKDSALSHIHKTLSDLGINANVLWSIDPLKNNIGLIDILPKTANKASALEFLRNKENLTKEDVVYCGDSGNDLQPLTQCYHSILVKNAPDDVKETVVKLVKEAGCVDTLYIATGIPPQNGNYASGIIEGLIHFGIITQ